MLGHPATIDTVASALEQYAFTNVVLDPVLFCKEVGEQTTPAARTDQALIQKILPFATFVTPNLDETAILAGLPGAGSITSVEDLTAAARAIHERSGAAVLAKGGVGLPGDEAVDVFVDGDQVIELRSPKVGQERVNGAGCTLAAAVTAEIAKGVRGQRDRAPPVHQGSLRRRVPGRVQRLSASLDDLMAMRRDHGGRLAQVLEETRGEERV
jgi:pyridoxine kinase